VLLSLRHHVQTGSGSHPASYHMRTGALVLRIEASIRLRGVVLRHRSNFKFTHGQTK